MTSDLLSVTGYRGFPRRPLALRPSLSTGLPLSFQTDFRAVQTTLRENAPSFSQNFLDVNKNYPQKQAEACRKQKTKGVARPLPVKKCAIFDDSLRFKKLEAVFEEKCAIFYDSLRFAFVKPLDFVTGTFKNSSKGGYISVLSDIYGLLSFSNRRLSSILAQKAAKMAFSFFRRRFCPQGSNHNTL